MFIFQSGFDAREFGLLKNLCITLDHPRKKNFSVIWAGAQTAKLGYARIFRSGLNA
jgi:hypothetical protein